MKEVNWKFNIGDEIKDDKRQLVIIDREIRVKEKTDNKSGRKYMTNEKWYKYKCNKCRNEDWIIEYNMSYGFGCNTCGRSPRKTVLGINTIWDKARWMCDLGVSEEDAKKYTPQSNKSINITCPFCGRTKKAKISNIYNQKSIGCICSDNHSYPEKFMYSMLKQLRIDFVMQLSKSKFKWCDKYRYDFYIPNLNVIVETHGIQHYEENSRGLSLQEEQENDKLKMELALNNGIEYYIIIDCRKSELEWIKSSILDNELNNIFDLKNIDWNKCEEFACNSNLIKEACNYKKENPNMTTTQIGNIMGYDSSTIRIWLKKGSSFGWCIYDAQKEKERHYINYKKGDKTNNNC